MGGGILCITFILVFIVKSESSLSWHIDIFIIHVTSGGVYSFSRPIHACIHTSCIYIASTRSIRALILRPLHFLAPFRRHIFLGGGSLGEDLGCLLI